MRLPPLPSRRDGHPRRRWTLPLAAIAVCYAAALLAEAARKQPQPKQPAPTKAEAPRAEVITGSSTA